MRHVKKVFTACLHATRTGWQLSFSNHDCDALIQAVAVVASVLDGTLEVLAGEEAGAINTRNERHLGELSQERERTPELARRNPKVAKKRASERAMSKNSDNKPKAYLL